MKKLDSNQDKESLLKEVKHLRKENKKLVSQKDKLKAKYEKTQKELEKKDVRKITLTDEQSRLLSSLFRLKFRALKACTFSLKTVDGLLVDRNLGTVTF